MVYRRVSNLFDYTLHVLVPWDLKLDISIEVYASSLFVVVHFFCAIILCLCHVHAYHHARVFEFSCAFLVFRLVLCFPMVL